MNRKALVLLPLAFATFVSVAARAEEKAPEPLWATSAELSVLRTSGNTQVRTLGLGIESTYRPKPWIFNGKASALSGANAGVTNAEAYTAELRGERKLSDTWGAFVRAGFLANRFAGFDRRFNGELGASYAFLDTEKHKLTAEVGGGANNEARTDGTNQTFATARLGVEYKWKFSPSAEFGNSFSVLENLQELADWRLVNIASLSATLTELLSLKVSFRIDHLNRPVAGKLATDTATTVALVAKW